jgi:hypothetical protein
MGAQPDGSAARWELHGSAARWERSPMVRSFTASDCVHCDCTTLGADSKREPPVEEGGILASAAESEGNSPLPVKNTR